MVTFERFIPSVLLGVSLAFTASSAFAQNNTLLAQSLFDEGRKLMEAGDYEHACPKLAESQKLDPGGGTLLNLAICYQKAGRIASAWATFEEARSAARKENDEARANFAKEQIAKLKPLVSRLTVVISPDSKLPGMQVKLDGQALPEAAWGTPMPVDPGSHHVEVTADGAKPWSTDINVGKEADQKSIQVPKLEKAATSASATAAAATQATSTISPASHADAQPANDKPSTPASGTSMDTSSAGGGSPTLGYILGGVGLVGVGVGSYFGLQAMSSWDNRNKECDDTGCTQKGIEYGDDTNFQANIANVGFGVGIVGLAVGGYLILTAPSSSEKQAAEVRVMPTVGRSTAGVSVGGTW